ADGKTEKQARSDSVDEAEAEQIPFTPRVFDLVISRHVLWTLPHPEAAIDEWPRVLRPGGRLAVVDGQFDPGGPARPSGIARTSEEYAAIGDQLPFLGGRPREDIETLVKERGLVRLTGDSLLDLVAAQEQRMVAEGREVTTHRRYVVWGDDPGTVGRTAWATCGRRARVRRTGAAPMHSRPRGARGATALPSRSASRRRAPRPRRAGRAPTPPA